MKKTVDTRWTLSYINYRPPRETVRYAIVVQLVVRHLAKVEVASSSLVYRSKGTERSVPFLCVQPKCAAGKAVPLSGS